MYPTGPLQVGEPQPFVRDAALLEEQLPRRDRGTDDSDHQKYKELGIQRGHLFQSPQVETSICGTATDRLFALVWTNDD